MSRQRSRHLKRQPTEEVIRQVVSDLVAAAGTVDVQRMSYDWRADDVLIQVNLAEPLSGSTLLFFQRELAHRLHSAIASDDPLRDWLVVIEHEKTQLARVTPRDTFDNALIE